MKKKNLTPAQQAVIKGMAAGWELGVSHGYHRIRVWLQDGGVGRGGKSAEIRHSTFLALKSAGLVVESSKNYPTTKYALTDAGRAAAKESTND